MSGAIEVSPARAGEAAALTLIARRAKASWGYPDSWLEAWREELTLTEEYLARTSVWVARVGGEPVALVAVEETGRPGSVGSLEHLWVDPRAQGRGLGRRLVEVAVEGARRRGLASLEVASDPGAEAFYLRLGARRVGSLPASMPGAHERVLPLLVLPTLPHPLDTESLGLAARELAERDAGLRAILEELGPPPLWDRPPGFPTLARIILEQQVSLASAASLARRLEGELGGLLSPEAVLRRGEEGLRGLGLTRQKARYVHALAEAVASGALDLDGLVALPDAEVRRVLTALPGIGRWTADVYLLMVLLRPDVWPLGDLALARAAADVLGGETPPSQAELGEIAERWRPWRSVAARLLWSRYLVDRGQPLTAGEPPR